MSIETTGDVVLEHAKEKAAGTGDGMRMLMLPHDPEHYYAGNIYLAALDIIRSLQAELQRKP